MKKPLLCVLGIHAFGRDGEGPDPSNPTRRCSMAYCSRSIFCDKRRVDGVVVVIPKATQMEREQRYSERPFPLPPASKAVTAEVEATPRVSDEDEEFLG